MSKKMHSVRAARRNAKCVAYSAHRPQFKSGDLIAQSHGGWGSWSEIQTLGIRVFTASTYSHVGVIYVHPDTGRVYVIEAVVPEVRIVPLSEIGSFYHLPMNAQWTDFTTRYACAQLGKPYSKWDAIRSYFGPLPPGTVSECAALVREVMYRAGVDLGRISRPDAVVQRAMDLRVPVTFVRNEKATKQSAYMETGQKSG